MSLSNFFGLDLEDDPIFGHQMRQMQQITNSLFSDPFGGGFGFGMPMLGMGFQNSLIPRGFPGSQMNRLLTNGGNNMGGVSYSSSSVYCMSSAGNGQPQIYKETSSSRIGPNGIRETRRTVEDSSSGTKKMAIGHHIGERARIVEKEQNVRTGQREEREELINLDESDTEEFERNFQQKASNYINPRRHQLTIEEVASEPLPAIQSAEDYNRRSVPHTSRRSALRSSPLALPSTSTRTSTDSSILHSHPYLNSGVSSRKPLNKNRKLKGHLNHH